MVTTPRIAFEELPEELRRRLAARVTRLGYLGEFFQVAANQPTALAGFIDHTQALTEALPFRVMQAIALTVAAATGNEYERIQHERLALRNGMSAEEVACLTGLRAAPGLLGSAEIAAAELASAVVRAGGRGSVAEYEILTGLVGPQQAVACLMAATRYLAHATMCNTWGVTAPVASPPVRDRVASDG
jgi:alkylhydroperoxidase family enzyme